MKTKITGVNEYIKGFPKEVQDRLELIRISIMHAAPDAEESISYGMPAYKLGGRALVYFCAFKQHIGFYALPSGHAQFASELSNYKQGKGSVQFPLDKPLPLKLIIKIVKFRSRENLEKVKTKKKG